MKLEKELLPNGAVRPLRSLEEVMKDYSKLSHDTAQIHYQIYVHNEEIEEKMKTMKALNKEAAIIQKFTQEQESKNGEETSPTAG